MIKRIIVGVDFSPVTAAVLDTAATIATNGGCKIYLVHVAPAFVADLKTVRVPQHDRDFLAHMLREEHRDLQALAKELGQKGCDVESLMVEGDRPVEKILDEARRLEADLIVIGSHGHGPIYNILVGSVSEGMLRKARTPVLIVPAMPDGADQARSTTSAP